MDYARHQICDLLHKGREIYIGRCVEPASKQYPVTYTGAGLAVCDLRPDYRGMGSNKNERSCLENAPLDYEMALTAALKERWRSEAAEGTLIFANTARIRTQSKSGL